ncbi:hypothetical protein VF14_08875 [Nostoc linckia z18]|uniref:Uncharacterized protein n=3 Tax=Nostoc linckia TaxID=92942 RepID=A0A9Q5ZEJ0_NOSLI|nr:hypothetical protein [Nostoc linckia]PHJ65145.1 hypothetical protein VF05_21650 [Nostoc linckia z3]PHJ83626.1 hypothetical protein VF06_12295 [Nostoc linckia z4]PHK22648.1 hypothetical protein VF11_04690 [Nostoc linckia z14]PHK42557.1 hypothetical protein VF12_02520 [Nostoc linckia z15]PHK44532.1 hypothetical protein VF13_21220 [Nostoc linckia z16]
MTQSNGGSKKPNPEDLEVYEPASAEEDHVGYFKTDIKGQEGELVSDDELPPEIKPDEPDER